MNTAEYDACWESIGALANWYQDNVGTRNEATTRLQLIDRLFFDCLGWERAIIYGDNVHYDPGRSPIANLFDLSSVDVKEHFLQALLLGHLRLPGVETGSEGFVQARRTFAYLQTLGFTPEQIDTAVSRCFAKRLLETGARRVPTALSDLDYSLRLTSVGLYHIRELTGTFTYLDAVVVDTPILDKDTRALIKEAHSLDERLERSMIFCSYLDRCWGAVEGQELPFDWPAQSAVVKRLMKGVATRA